MSTPSAAATSNNDSDAAAARQLLWNQIQLQRFLTMAGDTKPTAAAQAIQSHHQQGQPIMPLVHPLFAAFQHQLHCLQQQLHHHPSSAAALLHHQYQQQQQVLRNEHGTDLPELFKNNNSSVDLSKNTRNIEVATNGSAARDSQGQSSDDDELQV
jgi:hypothetical protein